MPENSSYIKKILEEVNVFVSGAFCEERMYFYLRVLQKSGLNVV